MILDTRPSLFQSNPEWFSRIERVYLSPIMIAARLATVLFVSSNTETARIVHHNPQLKPTAVTGFGISRALLDADPPAPPGLNVDHGSFVLSVGRLNTRKNLATTMSGAVRSGSISPARPFVVVGPRNGKVDQLDQRLLDAIDAGSIRYTGVLRDRAFGMATSQHCAVRIPLAGRGLRAIPAPGVATRRTRVGERPTHLSRIAPNHRSLLRTNGRYSGGRGRNDYEACTAAVAGAVAAPLFNSKKSLAPNAELIATSPIWDSTDPPQEFALLLEDIETATAEAGACYLDLGEPLAGRRSMIDDDGLHPNDSGHRAIAQSTVQSTSC